MKKMLSVLLILVFVISVTACGNTGTGSVENNNTETEQTTIGLENETEQISIDSESGNNIGKAEDNAANTDTVGNTLIIYFSESGNTETIANYIHDEIGGDMVEIVPVVEYPHVYEELADYAKKEQDSNARPEFENLGVDPASYQTVFIGYPIWWYSLPMIMETFLDTYDFTGVTIVPFNTHEGSRDGGTYDMIREREPNATVLEGLPIRGSDAASDESRKAVEEWLRGLDLE